MQIEVGKSYRTRNGEKVTILSKQGGQEVTWPFAGDNGQDYTRGGRYWDEEVKDDKYDLVAEWVDEAPVEMPTFDAAATGTPSGEPGFDFKVGSTWRTRDGKKVAISKLINSGEYVATANNGYTYTAQGRIFVTGEDECDIVAPWTEIKADISETCVAADEPFIPPVPVEPEDLIVHVDTNLGDPFDFNLSEHLKKQPASDDLKLPPYPGLEFEHLRKAADAFTAMTERERRDALAYLNSRFGPFGGMLS